MWHVSRVFRLPPLLLLLALAGGGCASSVKKEDRLSEMANSRAIEQRRMQKIEGGDVASPRGAEILVADPSKTFDPSRSAVGTLRPYGTGGARTKDFNYAGKVRVDRYDTREFAGSKANAAAQREYATTEAHTRGKYVIPNADKKTGEKTAATKELADGRKVAATRDLRDGKRPYLGPESKKLGTAVDAKSLADWRSAGRESVSYSDSTVERFGNLKQLSIEDVRELLNKNK